MAAPEEKAIEFVPMIEETLDNGMALVMVACGIVAGAFCYWAFLEYRKSEAARRVGIAMTERGIPLPLITEPHPQQRGDNEFDAYNPNQANAWQAPQG